MNNPLHSRALHVLTHDWQPFAAVREASGLDLQTATVMDDLRWAGRIAERRDPVTRNGIPSGERIFYKLPN